MSSSVQSLKSAQVSRVRLDTANRIAQQRMLLGEGSMCPAGVGDQFILVDGRPAGKFSSFDMGYQRTAPECSHYAISAAEMIAYESNQRPQMPLCSTGIKHSDTQGVGRDMFPRDIYNERTGRGAWNKLYSGANNVAREIPPKNLGYITNAVPKYNPSMSADSVMYYG